jgi:hypothetical protein
MATLVAQGKILNTEMSLRSSIIFLDVEHFLRLKGMPRPFALVKLTKTFLAKDSGINGCFEKKIIMNIFTDLKVCLCLANNIRIWSKNKCK